MAKGFATTETVRSVFVAAPRDFEISDSKYVVRFARNAEEIDAALKLRFEVFNLELAEGLATSFLTGRDRDQFDDTCHHLIALDRFDEKVIGTYRLRTIEMAGDLANFYSSAEFDLMELPAGVLRQSIELGRACIAQSHRNRQVLFLLWQALLRYAGASGKRFLFGCCSLTSQEPAEGKQLLEQLKASGQMHSHFRVSPRAGYVCESDESWPTTVKIPRLFGTYLSVGAKVCSEPAIDREFKTIDFFVLFDLQEMGAATRRMFFGAENL